MTKVLNNVEIGGSDCNIIKVIYWKSTSNIIVINEKDKKKKKKKKPRIPVINIAVHYKFRSPRQGIRLEMEIKGFHLEGKK